MDTLKAILAPARALVVATVGLWLAGRWFSRADIATPLVVAVVVVIAAHLLESIGRRLIRSHPVVAVVMMEAWILAPIMLATLAGAAVVVIAVLMEPSKEAPADVGALTKGLATAITTFLTAGFVSWTGDADKSLSAKRIKRSFEQAFLGVDLPKEAELLVYSEAHAGIEGWSLSSRFERAQRLAKELGAAKSRGVTRAP